MPVRSLTINATVIDRKHYALGNELLRKSIHMLIGLVPFFASKNLYLTVIVVAIGLFSYTFNEYFHAKHKKNFSPISRITELASRDRDKGHFVMGPLTLLSGVLLALIFFPHPASALAIYALAFGDGLASLVGKVWGKTRIPFIKDKTLEGSLACFGAVFLASFHVLHDILLAFEVALFATLLEAIPLKDYDNVIIPLGTGIFSLFLLGMV
ncbi:MAG: SEC59/DGK1/VTE5 family protein [Spirochaetales bacterium]|nr:SEC59/DGK1/VTE5 family protein [Spirochaetales bacterium]